MSMWARPRATRTATVDGPLIPPRGGSGRKGAVPVNDDTALRHSAVWAALRLRADLMSTFPVDSYRKVRLGGAEIDVEVPNAPVLVEPGGKGWEFIHWMYAREFDLARSGNAVGVITETNALGLPARIDLKNIAEVTVRQPRGKPVEYWIAGKYVPTEQIWHDRCYVVAGLPVGLSPLAYAAWTIGEYLSLQEFALEWFGTGGVPKAALRNTEKVVSPEQASIIKSRFKATMDSGDLFVHGKDWEYKPIQAEQAGLEFIEGRKFGLADIARFIGVPADLIDAAVSGQSITYANMTQRNLQFLIMNLGPAVVRAEAALTALLPRPRFVKLNTKALLRMDPKTSAEMMKIEIESRTLTNSEARALQNRPPLTPQDIEEFATVYGGPRTQPTTATAGGQQQ